MDATDRTEARLTELEIKLSYAEDTLERLNDVIVRQQSQIDLLTRELLRLRERPPGDLATPGADARTELPPHY